MTCQRKSGGGFVEVPCRFPSEVGFAPLFHSSLFRLNMEVTLFKSPGLTRPDPRGLILFWFCLVGVGVHLLALWLLLRGVIRKLHRGFLWCTSSCRTMQRRATEQEKAALEQSQQTTSIFGPNSLWGPIPREEEEDCATSYRRRTNRAVDSRGLVDLLEEIGMRGPEQEEPIITNGWMDIDEGGLIRGVRRLVTEEQQRKVRGGLRYRAPPEESLEPLALCERTHPSKLSVANLRHPQQLEIKAERK